MKIRNSSVKSAKLAIQTMSAAGLILLAGAAANAQTIVDNSGSARDGKVGYWSSIVARSGEVGISYYCEDDHANVNPEMYTLRFAWRTGSDWQWTTVAPSAGSHTTMCRGTDGLYRIIYDNWDGMGFATGSGATWDTTSVNLEPGISPTQMSMTLDSQQRPHVAYMNIANGGDYSMRYTRWDGAQWVRDAAEVLLPDVWTPTIGFSNTWLQLDSSDTPHIAFADPTDAINAWGAIRYATLNNGTWTYEDIGIQGVDPSLVIGTDDQPRMMFNSDFGITYAYKDTSGWHFETVRSNESGNGIALTLNDQNQPYATFGMTGFEDQYIARRDAGGWVLSMIDGDGTGSPHELLGRYGNSIDVDEAGTPHVSYLNIDIYGPTHRCDLMYFGDAGGPPPCIRIIDRPRSVTVCGTEGAQFTALGEATVPPTYAWEWQAAGTTTWTSVVEGFNISNLTSETFLASGSSTQMLSLLSGGIGITDSAAFRCILTSTCGTEATPPATLSIGAAPIISSHPHDARVCGIGSAQFETVVQGAVGYRWQWLAFGTSDWLDIAEGENLDPVTSLVAFNAGGTAASGVLLSNIDLPFGATHQIRCVVIGSCGDALTNAATLSASSGVEILDQPVSQTLCQGLPATFSISTQDPAGAQWEMYEPDTLSWIAITDGLNEHSVLGNFDAAGAGDFSITMVGFTDDNPTHSQKTGTMLVRCRLSGSCGEAMSDAAQLEIIECCLADFNRDGVLDFFDYLDFVDAFASGDIYSDFNEDGIVDFFDYLDFVDGFSTGC